MVDDVIKIKLYDLIITALPVGFFTVDADFKILEFNEAAEKLTGWSREEAIGKTCSEVLKSSLCGDDCPLQQSAERGEYLIGKEAIIQTRYGDEIPISFSSSTYKDDTNKMRVGIEVFRDNSDRKKLELEREHFVSVLTHDLKAPVSVTGGFLMRLLQEKAGSLTPKQRQYLQTIDQENQRIDRLLNDFLYSLQIETGHTPLNCLPCRIKNIIGSGLGLASANAIIKAHGGQIWVESILDKGSSFFIKVPNKFI